MRLSPEASKDTAFKILAMKDDILAVSIIDAKMNVLPAVSKDDFKKDFWNILRGRDRYG